ncbi:MAG: hypothetical protein GY821_10400, partial [Gammaproteobacteria bacterium]|nr:hypothetical protein [Gammaproteobacteria bacterium]
FSKCKTSFRDVMTHNAAIGRLIYHAVIWQRSAPSYRQEQAKKIGVYPSGLKDKISDQPSNDSTKN